MDVIKDIRTHMENICNISMTLDMREYEDYCKSQLPDEAVAKIAKASKPRADHMITLRELQKTVFRI